MYGIDEGPGMRAEARSQDDGTEGRLLMGSDGDQVSTPGRALKSSPMSWYVVYYSVQVSARQHLRLPKSLNNAQVS